MSDALAKVKIDLGREAVILHTRTIKRGGILGLGARSLVEITATADPRLSVASAAAGAPLSGPVEPAAEPAPPRRDDRASSKPSPAAPIQPAAPAPVPTADAGPDLKGEVLEIRNMVKDLLRRTGQERPPNVPDQLLEYYTHLIGQDVAEDLAAQILDRVAERIRDPGASHWDEHGRPVSDTRAAEETIREVLQAALMETLPPAQPLEISTSGRPTVVAMVGPTGVGKTTTIAKLAANMKLRENKKVGLITIDTYRIAAVEQLKTYADILKVPLMAVTSPQEMEPALRRMADLDLVLIDTAGRSQKDEMRIAELACFLDAARPDQVHLVLSMASREEALQEAVRSFSVLGPQHVVFTKLDEAVGFGVILNVLRSVDMRLSYLTNGQSVPADIEPGSPDRVARLILGPEDDEARPVGACVPSSKAVGRDLGG